VEKKTPSRDLTPRQTAAALALLTEPTQEKAALKAKVSIATLRRWLELPAFQAELTAGRRRLVETTVGWLQTASVSAVAALVRNLTCSKPSVEVAAAVAILDRCLRGHELLTNTAELVARVEELERQLLPKRGA
jgi:hypothetical protein